MDDVGEVEVWEEEGVEEDIEDIRVLEHQSMVPFEHCHPLADLLLVFG